MSDRETSPYRTVKQVAAYTGYHEQTIRHALQDRSLIGRQLTEPNGRWRIHIDAVNAWMTGEKPAKKRHLRSA